MRRINIISSLKPGFKVLNLSHVLCTLCMAMLLAGCYSNKNVATGTANQTQAKVRYEAAVGQNFDYDCLQSKVKYLFEGKSLSGKMNLEHGKRLCLTATVLGIEVARIEANTEWVYIVDKFDKVYAEVPIAEFASRMGLQEEAKLETLEALLLGRMYLPGKGEAKASDFKQFVWNAAEKNGVCGQYKATKYALTYFIDADNNLCKTQVEVPSNDMTFTWSYTSYQEAGKGKMPSAETLQGQSPSLNLSAQITMGTPTLSKKGWNSFTPASNYKKVSVTDLVEMIKNLKN